MVFLFFCFFLSVFGFCDVNSASVPDYLLAKSDNPKCGPIERNRIFNGEVASIYDHPWYALLKMKKGNEGEERCGGSLINYLHVLTAAHCFKGIPDPEEVTRVWLSEFNTTSNPDGRFYSLEFGVENVFTHEKFKIRDPSYHNDIAIVRLKKSAPENHRGLHFYKLACLPLESAEQEIPSGTELTVTGFGKTNVAPEEGKMSTIKRKTSMKVIDAVECQRLFDAIPDNVIRVNDEVQFCAVGIKKSEGQFTDSCNGDSGGPFVANNKFVVGLVSFGHTECGLDKAPAIYTRVSNFIEWIKETISEGIEKESDEEESND